MPRKRNLPSNRVNLGISSWTYPWAIGVSGYPRPVRPLRLADLLERAAELKVRVVQIADNLPLHQLESSEIRDVREQAESLGIKIEIGTRGVEPDHLLLHLSFALQLNAALVRTLTHTSESRPSLEQAGQWIRKALPEFEANGVMLGLENYEAHSCCSLAALVRGLDSNQVGICLDTVNSLGALEPLGSVVDTLAPLTVNLHVKDFVIERPPHKMGFVVRGVPAGSGSLDIPWLLSQMRRHDISIILEQWPPPQDSVEATIAMERDWAERGVHYLRSCGCN